MSLIEKIDTEIFQSGAEMISIKNKGMFVSLDEIRKIIKDIDLSEQKESCEFCEDGIYHDVLGSPCKYYYCPMCGRPLNQPYTEVYDD